MCTPPLALVEQRDQQPGAAVAGPRGAASGDTGHTQASARTVPGDANIALQCALPCTTHTEGPKLPNPPRHAVCCL